MSASRGAVLQAHSRRRIWLLVAAALFPSLASGESLRVTNRQSHLASQLQQLFWTIWIATLVQPEDHAM